MKKWIAAILTLALLCGMGGFAMADEADEQAVIEILEADAPDGEMPEEAPEIFLDDAMEEAESSFEADAPEITGAEGTAEAEAQENAASNATSDFTIVNGVLTKYNGSGTVTWKGHTYQLFDIDGITTWGAAKSYCESLGGYLATITSAEEDTFIYNNVVRAAGYESAYFGFSDAEAEGTWKWVTKESVQYLNWAPGEPNNENSNEDYGMYYWKFKDGSWNDGDFNNNTDSGGRAFICEWGSYLEKETPTPTPPPIPATSPILAAESAVIGVKEKFTLIAADSPVAASACTFKTLDKAVATVSVKGVVTGKKKGTTTITVTPPSGAPISFSVTVKSAPKSVSLSPKKVTVGVGETLSPFAAKLPSGSASALTWSSSKKKYATVDADGRITGKKKGKTTVTVKTYNGKKATSTVTVVPAPKSVSFGTDSIALAPNDSAVIAASVNKGSGGGITYEVLDTGVATYSNGRIKTGGATGETVLRATTYNGLTADLRIVVCNPPTELYVPEKLTIGLKEKIPLGASYTEGTYTQLTYTSKKPKVVAVNSSGMLTAKKVGTAKIIVKTRQGLKAVCVVTVKKLASSFTLKPTSVEMKPGETKQLKLSFKKNTAVSVKWSSSDNGVATVDKNGLVTAVGGGTATITVKSLSGKVKKTCEVKVGFAPISIDGIPHFGQRSSYVIPTSINPRGVSVSVLVDGAISDCGICCAAMIEGYFKGYPSEDTNVYHAVIAARNPTVRWESITSDPTNDIGVNPANRYQTLLEGYNASRGMSAQEIYEQLKAGNPVMVHREQGAKSEHWVVIYGYDGPADAIDWASFKIMSPYGTRYARGVEYLHLYNLISDYDQLNLFMYRTSGLSNLPKR